MDVREALIQAAIKVFAATGTHGATTRRIAQEAGVNEVTLFRHFKGKDDLIRAALEHFGQQAMGRALPDEPVDPETELVQWSRRHHRELHKVRALVRKSMGEFEEFPANCEHGLRASVRIADELTDYLRALRRTGLATGDWDERAAAAMLMGAIFSDAMGRDTTPERYPYSMREASEHYVRLLLTAIGVRRAAAAGDTAPVRKSS